ncbi:response regulator [Labilibaculum sp. A4]|uniref:response regulator transcription factor n=1 Tax=Labilibaculum euxinus TaxID=2686357 RepID=UPI000F61F6C6|nr:response regulator transcription factor [Labilibaculum euxinus]MDQ1771909.1 response regulator transcription factor [Labilibaculum euxinus]MWN77814.1 response regulator [Labilibaculum euxinus]
MTEALKLALVDDHDLFREGLSFLLNNQNSKPEIKEVSNGQELLDLLAKWQADIILMDIEMPVMNGIEASNEVMKKYPASKIIALSMHANENYYSEMIDAGAKAFLLKNSSFEEVQQAIEAVMEGRNYFSPEILESIIANLNRKKNQPSKSDLTQREVEILYNICKGLSNQEIAEMLFISKRTVDKHRENILLKTQSKNTASLVIYAIKNHIFEV